MSNPGYAAVVTADTLVVIIGDHPTTVQRVDRPLTYEATLAAIQGEAAVDTIKRLLELD